jgi:hypothetical protein
MAVAHNRMLTNMATLAGQLIPQESPSGRLGRPRATLEGAILPTMPGPEDLTGTTVLARIGRVRGPCEVWGTGSFPIPAPDTATATLRPSVVTQPATLPLPNPEPEVAR